MAAETFKLALVLKAFDGVTQPLRRINSALEQVQKPLRNFEKAFGNFKEASGFNRLGESLSGVKDSALKVGGAVFSLASKFALVGGVAAGIFGKIVNDTVESASKLVDLRNATGASVESIQRLGYAFEQSGGTTEDFQSGLVKFSKNLGDAKRHAGPLFQVLSKYDRPLLQKMLSTKDTGEALSLFINKISQAKNDTTRLSLATAAVGKSLNVSLASLAKDGPEGLQKLMAETPGVISDEQATKAESFGDVLHRLSRQFGAMALPIVNSVIPSLDKLAQDLTSFFKGKEQSIKDWAKDFGEKLPGRIELIKVSLQKLWDSLKPVRDAITWITSDSDRLQTALKVLAVIIAGNVITSTLGFVGSLGKLSVRTVEVISNLSFLASKLSIGNLFGTLTASITTAFSAIKTLTTSFAAFGATLLANPITWYVAGLMALIGAGYLVYKYWDQIKDFFITLWDSPAGKLFRFITPIGWLIDFGIQIYKNWGVIKEFFIKMWDSPLGKLLAFTTPIGWLIKAGQEIYENWDKIAGVFGKAFGYAKQFFGFSGDSGNYNFSDTPTGQGASGGNYFDGLNNDGFQNLTSVTGDLNETMGSISESMSNQKSMADLPSTANPEAAQKFMTAYNLTPPAPPPPQVITKEASITVRFENTPAGTQIEKDPGSQAPVNIDRGINPLGA